MVERRAILDTNGVVADDDIRVYLVENAAGIDRIVLHSSIGQRTQLLTLGLRRRGTNPVAVVQLDIRQLRTQRIRLDGSRILRAYQFARGRTVVDNTRLTHLIDDGRNVGQRLLGFGSLYARDATGEVAVANGAIVLVGDTGAVDGGFYDTDHAQALEQRILMDGTEQAPALVGGGIVLDGVATAIELTPQTEGASPVLQFQVASQVEDAVFLVDVVQLLGGIDVAAFLRLERHLDIVVRHREREGIDIVHIVGERTTLSIAAVRVADGDARQVVVAIDAHGGVDDGAGTSAHSRQRVTANDTGGIEDDGKVGGVLITDAGSKDWIVG